MPSFEKMGCGHFLGDDHAAGPAGASSNGAA